MSDIKMTKIQTSYKKYHVIFNNLREKTNK